MGLFNLIVVGADGTLLTSYYFADCQLAAQDAWEDAVAESTRELLPHALKPDARDLCTVCDGRAVVIRGKGEVLYILSGNDELEREASGPRLACCKTKTNAGRVPFPTVACVLDAIVALIAAVCENRLSPKLLAEYHGKVAVCLSEMFPSGVQAYSDVEAVLRNSKLKAPHV